MIRLPAGRSSTSIPGSDSPSSSLGLGQPQPALAAGEQRARDLGEVPLDGGERLREPPLDRLRQLPPELVQLVERPLEVGALRAQLLEVLLLPLVLLLRERIDAAELLAPALEPLRASPASSSRGPSAGSAVRLREPASRLRRLGLEPRQLDLDRGRSLAGAGRLVPELGLRGAEAPQLGRELARARRTPFCVSASSGASRRRAGLDAASELGLEPLGERDEHADRRADARLGCALPAPPARGPAPASSRNCASSSSWIASAASPTNHSSPRAGS